VQGKYETSAQLKQIGVISGEDITMEAAVTKLMFLLAQKLPVQKLKKDAFYKYLWGNELKWLVNWCF
jgi:L-asparaginase/Glu-tRNA(Gln) amidotransferase subunit D